MDKSLISGQNMKVSLIKTFEELINVIKNGIIYKKNILIEEFISGKPFTIHSITGFRGKDIYILPPTSLSNEIGRASCRERV